MSLTTCLKYKQILKSCKLLFDDRNYKQRTHVNCILIIICLIFFQLNGFYLNCKNNLSKQLLL